MKGYMDVFNVQLNTTMSAFIDSCFFLFNDDIVCGSICLHWF